MSLERNKEDEARRLFEKGEAFYDDGPVDKAIDIFDRLLSEYAEFVDIGGIHYWLGCSYYEKGLYDKALTHLKESRRHFDKSRPRQGDMATLHFLAMTQWSRNEYGEALKYLDEGEQYFHLYDDKEHVEAQFNFRKLKGDVYLWSGEHDKAIEQYKAAFEYVHNMGGERDEREAELYYSIGSALLLGEELDEAAGFFRRVKLPQLREWLHPDYYMDMEKLCLKRREYSAAIDNFHALVTVGIPENWRAEAYNYAGRAYYYLGDGSNARKYFEESGKYPSNREWIEESNRAFLEELAKAGH